MLNFFKPGHGSVTDSSANAFEAELSTSLNFAPSLNLSSLTAVSHVIQVQMEYNFDHSSLLTLIYVNNTCYNHYLVVETDTLLYLITIIHFNFLLRIKDILLAHKSMYKINEHINIRDMELPARCLPLYFVIHIIYYKFTTITLFLSKYIITTQKNTEFSQIN